MNRNEQYYRHIMGAIGATMLFFLLYINVFGVLLGLVETFGLFSILRDYAVSETLYQLIYGGGYLLCFMLPVPIFKRLIKRKGHPYYPMKAPLSATPCTPVRTTGSSLRKAFSPSSAMRLCLPWWYSAFLAYAWWSMAHTTPSAPWQRRKRRKLYNGKPHPTGCGFCCQISQRR